MERDDALIGASEPAALLVHLELFDVGAVHQNVHMFEHRAVRHLFVAASVQSQMVLAVPNFSRTARTILRISS